MVEFKTVPIKECKNCGATRSYGGPLVGLRIEFDDDRKHDIEVCVFCLTLFLSKLKGQ